MSSAAGEVASLDVLTESLARGAMVVDLRMVGEEKSGDVQIVEGALSAPWDGSALPLDALPSDLDAPIVVHCRSGQRASHAVRFLAAHGFTRVLNGGGPAKADLFSSAFSCRGIHTHSTLGYFQQLFDGPEGSGSSTLTYILGDYASKEAIIIDPVIENVERDLAAIAAAGLRLVLALNTHAHADHITGTGEMKKRVPGLRSAISSASGASADVQLEPLEEVVWAHGARKLMVLPTPGHTSGCVSFHDEQLGAVFTGDALLIGGCGRTDFQGGSAEQLYDSVHTQLFSRLPPSTVVYPAHDYKGRRRSTLGAERKTNPRLTKALSDFVVLMSELKLSPPKKIGTALPANMVCGI